MSVVTPSSAAHVLQRRFGNQGLQAALEARSPSGRNALLQRRAAGESQSATAPPIVHEVLGSPGRPLAQGTREFMESRFGHDFSAVRLHTDLHAAESAGAVNALAYTVGQDVVFGAGQYQPETTAGKRLLAHELTHTIQQAAGLQTKLEISAPGDRHEQEAEHMAALTIGTREPLPVYSATGTGVARQLMKQQAGKSKAVEKEDPNEKELREKVGSLVKSRFKGDYKAAFDSYAGKDNAVDADEITRLLEDAHVGYPWTRGKWASEILAKMDKNKNNKIEWAEFESGIKK
jgi:hypothetical protein